MTAGNVRFDSASFWVQIWGAPFDMVSLSVVEAVGMFRCGGGGGE